MPVVVRIDDRGAGGPLSTHQRNGLEYTEALPGGDLAGSRRDLAVVLLPVEAKGWRMCVAYVCLASRGRRVTTRQAAVGLTHLVPVVPPLPVREWHATTDAAYRTDLGDAVDWSGREIPPPTWNAARAALVRLRPSLAVELDRLMRLLRPRLRRSPHVERILGHQKDAVAVAVGAHGFDRRLIDRWVEPDADDSSTAPWLAGLLQGRVREDQVVVHDAGRLPRWWPHGEPYVGVAAFTNPGGRRLTVMNVNRHPIEEVTGVDLLYYLHEAHSFTLVQYKMFRDEVEGEVFRPDADGNLAKELARMRAVDDFDPVSEGAVPADPVWSYRLLARACWLKLCSPRRFTPYGSELIPGTYLPLEFYDRLVAAGAATRGPRGGIVLSERRMERWLNNTLFTGLMGGGWVGTADLHTDRIAGVVEAALAGRRSLVLADARRDVGGGT